MPAIASARPIAYYDARSRQLHDVDDAYLAICRSAPLGALAEAHANVDAIGRMAQSIARCARECAEAGAELSELCRTADPAGSQWLADDLAEAAAGSSNLTGDAARLLTSLIYADRCNEVAFSKWRAEVRKVIAKAAPKAKRVTKMAVP